MRTISYQYITNISGERNGVILSYNDWERILKELDELDKLRNKQIFFQSLKDAFDEVKLIKQGKKKPNSFKELINELRDNSD